MEFVDNGGHFPDLESARAYVSGAAGSNTSADYHSDRIRALRYLMQKVPNPKAALDFGCGDGMYLQEFCPNATRLEGVDISSAMIRLATEKLRKHGFVGHVGGVEKLKEIDAKFDLAFAVDVLGYLTEKDVETFYREAARLIKTGGHLIVMYGNELFDLYALNAGTATFFQKHFNVDPSELLTESRARQYKPANRKNPLNFGAGITPFGFTEIAQSFSQWHRVPPGIGNRDQNDLSAARMSMRDHAFDPNRLPPNEKWKAAFRCSIFGSLARRA